MEKKVKSADQVFTQWKTFCEKDVGKVRYTSEERLEQLDFLCEMFVKFGVPFDDAMDYKRKFVEFMVTREGMKGNGKHKGWKEKAGENFEGILLGFYDGTFKVVNDVGAISIKNEVKTEKQEYGHSDYMIRMPIIIAWSKNKFGESWSESICLEAHKIASSLNSIFVREVIDSNWSKSGEDIPSWAKSSCY